MNGKLTWQEVKKIVEIADKMLYDGGSVEEIDEREEYLKTEEAYYKEVLRRYEEGE